MLEHGRVQDKERIIDVVKAKILDFAMDKHSSETLRASWRSIGGGLLLFGTARNNMCLTLSMIVSCLAEAMSTLFRIHKL